MRDYPQGAFEALSWVRIQFNHVDTRCKGCQRILEEVEQVLEEIQQGVAVDFTFKVSQH